MIDANRIRAVLGVPSLALLFWSASLAADSAPIDANHPAPSLDKGAGLSRLTTHLTAQLPSSEGPPLQSRNYVDQLIFRKIRENRVPHAALCSDAEYLRRASLDLTGRLPEPEAVREFLKDTDPLKRDKLVDSFMVTSTKGQTKKPSTPFLDRWAYFLSDLYKVNALMGQGKKLFHQYLYNALAIDQPYDEFVRELITPTARSNFNTAPVNFLVHFNVDQPDQSTVNPEDTYDEIAIRTSRMFLGVNLECISCHDGARHLEKINGWLAARKRADLWRQAAFFGKIRLYRPYGDLWDEFVLSNEGKGYNTASASVVRLPRWKADTTPTFILTGEQPKPGEDPREAYARMLTSNPQFARTTVNLIWAELFGAGIVDPPLDFDLTRKPMALHEELLDALAKDFIAHHYDLRYIIRVMATSAAYQLSHRLPAAEETRWKPEYAGYFARHLVRRIPAEQVWDGICQATGVFGDIGAKDAEGGKLKYVMQIASPEDLEPKLNRLLSAFGMDDRRLGSRSLSGSPVQASILLNSDLVKEKVRVDSKGRLNALWNAEPQKTNAEIVEEMFLASLSRMPSREEAAFGEKLLAERHAKGAEDLMWVLLNKPEFVLNY
ncbi:MAG: DUF1549 and DUF1553 domain-containing protein [Acidobacteriota bacterium]|nr:DUF1549 and DUF1553 domain-containing protein [Acidobacteriota bacterium]